MTEKLQRPALPRPNPRGQPYDCLHSPEQAEQEAQLTSHPLRWGSPAPSLAGVERAMLAARRSGRSPHLHGLPVGSWVRCPLCDSVRELRQEDQILRWDLCHCDADGPLLGSVTRCSTCDDERCYIEVSGGGRSLRLWSDCTCFIAKCERLGQLSEQSAERERGSRSPLGADDPIAYSAESLLQTDRFTPARFDRSRLIVPPDGEHPFAVALRWLGDILDLGRQQWYGEWPYPALYIQGPPGRGKTLAAKILIAEAQRRGRTARYINEPQYLRRVSNMPFGEGLNALIDSCERPWLMLYDDVGKTSPGSEADKRRVQRALYNAIDPRYDAVKFCIFTSERSIEQLHEEGTIDYALFNRLYEMTGGSQLTFAGTDSRLLVGGER